MNPSDFKYRNRSFAWKNDYHWVRPYGWIFFLLIFLVTSCRQSNLQGKWKPVSQTFDNVMQWQQPFQINLDQPDSLKAFMLREQLLNGTAGQADTEAILIQMDSMVKYYQNSRLILNTDLSFIMINNGFIIPNSIPGWHLGDTLTGSWYKQTDSLYLKIGDKETFFPIQYRIMKNSDDSLVLRELLYATEAKPSREIIFIRE